MARTPASTPAYEFHSDSGEHHGARHYSPALEVRSFGVTHAGKVRPSNEDQFFIAHLTKALHVKQSSLPYSRVQYGDEVGYLFLVADGMGGHAAGEQASALAVDAIENCVLNTFKWFFQLRGGEEQEVLHEFKQAVRSADAKLFAEIDQHPELGGMGTTVTLAYSLNARLFVAHVGDSRCYLLREGTLYRLTRDHTMAQDMLKAGYLTPDQAARNPYRHVITNVVGGTTPGVQVEVHKLELRPGDRVLLCSDGLTEMLPDREITEVLEQYSEPRGACEHLLEQALDQGGRDNVTVIVADYAARE